MAERRELILIRLKEEVPRGVERIEVAIEEFRCQFVVKPVMPKLRPFQHFGRETDHIG
jgi:hypothetical protein